MGPASVCSWTRSPGDTPSAAAGSTGGMPPSERPAPPWRWEPPRPCSAGRGGAEHERQTRIRMTTGALEPGVVLAEIRDAPLSVDEVVAAVGHRTAGAVVTFIGYVRERDHGEAVEVLDYSSHPTANQVAE